MKINQFTLNDIYEFEIDLTGTCNLQCPICTRNYHHSNHLLKKNIRPLSDIIWQLDQFPNLNRIMLAGAVSEPTLYPNFLELIDYLNFRNIYIDLFTNGDTRDISFWETLGLKLEKGNQNNTCTFTICGSTNELHSKYRIGSDLNKIKNNITSFKKYSKKDIVQLMEFQYNKEDIRSENMKTLLTELNINKYYVVHSEGRRRLMDYKKKDFLNPNTGIWPTDEIEKKYQLIHKKIKGIKKVNPNKLICKSIQSRKLHIDHFGNIHACYMLMEFPESKNSYFYSFKEFKEAVKNNRVIFDFQNIHSCGFEECKYCDKNITKYIDILGLDFIC